MPHCPYCAKDDIHPSGMVPHIRMSDDEAHGPQGSLPDDAEDKLNESTEGDVQFVSFEDADPGLEADETGEAGRESCPDCGGELYALDEGEPIEDAQGRVIGHGEDGDVICTSCGELVEGEVQE